MSTPDPFDQIRRTLAYYDDHAGDFISGSVSLDMTEFYMAFLANVPNGGRILDAGCGSGRDSLYFLRRGFDVVSIDGCPSMVDATNRLTGQTALQMRFDEIAFVNDFDGIWACASLLHVPRQRLPAIFARLTTALRTGGILYVSFKYGDSERADGDRFFNDLNEPLLRGIVDSQSRLHLLTMWTTEDKRPQLKGRYWLNGLVGKRSDDDATRSSNPPIFLRDRPAPLDP